MKQDEFEQVNNFLSYEHDIELTKEDMESLETITIKSTMSVFHESLNLLPKLKTLILNPNIDIWELQAYKDELKTFLENGKTIEWIDGSERGVRCTFDLEYGVDDCMVEATMLNDRYLFADVKDVVAFLEDPEPFVDDMFGFEEGPFDIFADLTSTIEEDCGDGEDQFCNIVEIRNDEEHVLWSAN